ncbi:uncharacterized protein BDR25DRAFT_311859 [Lindgomyces ingoldianus]|uniref:Uncharacterized protein n=1 Tax=Lindgomyces ingoldianus TaxID=673940 RepID=A0ACB6R5S2_9PLEO|nr:uncharacterized protein BDR25DRAFT_311859 [Lindgomyces ingoldianus]KAF2473647.1 hypothetical protein BDR25DRAFT_311859 [Lindgomyces ingoldianus]
MGKRLSSGSPEPAKKRRREEPDAMSSVHRFKIGEKANEEVAPATHKPMSSKLEFCLTQYDILQRIARHSTSIDLFRIAWASKTAWRSIRKTDERWQNLTDRNRCCGFGVRYRKQDIYCEVSIGNLVYDPSIAAVCGGDPNESMDSKLCVSCKSMVCDNF